MLYLFLIIKKMYFILIKKNMLYISKQKKEWKSKKKPSNVNCDILVNCLHYQIPNFLIYWTLGSFLENQLMEGMKMHYVGL